MQLSETAVKEFCRLYKMHFGISISYEQAKLDGLTLIKLVSKIQPEMNNENEMQYEIPKSENTI